MIAYGDNKLDLLNQRSIETWHLLSSDKNSPPGPEKNTPLMKTIKKNPVYIYLVKENV